MSSCEAGYSVSLVEAFLISAATASVQARGKGKVAGSENLLT